MSARIEETIEVILEVRDQFRIHKNTRSIRELRIVATKSVADIRGITHQTVCDTYRRQLRPEIKGTEQFDLYLEKWLKNENLELRNILLKKTSDNSDKELINNTFHIAPEEDILLSEEYGFDPNEEEYREGKDKLRIHLLKERNSSLVKKAMEIWKEQQNEHFCCEVCSFSFENKYGQIGEGYIEAHHKIPISNLTSETKIKVSDLTPVCSNCHRMLHRKRPWLTVEQLQDIVKT